MPHCPSRRSKGSIPTFFTRSSRYGAHLAVACSWLRIAFDYSAYRISSCCGVHLTDANNELRIASDSSTCRFSSSGGVISPVPAPSYAVPVPTEYDAPTSRVDHIDPAPVISYAVPTPAVEANALTQYAVPVRYFTLTTTRSRFLNEWLSEVARKLQLGL